MTDLHLKARDGFRLAATAYTARRPVKRKVVIVNAAAGVPRRAYDAFASLLASAGYPVVTYDFRGVGASRPPSLKGFEARLKDWGEQDFAGILDWTAGAYPGFRKVLVGHRLGGAVAALAPNLDVLSGFFAVGVASEYWPLNRGLRRLWLYPRWRLFIPGNVAAFGYLPSWPLGFEFDLPAGVARDRARYGLMQEHIFGDIALDAKARAARFSGQILVAEHRGDWRAPDPAVEAIVSQFTNAQVKRWEIERRAIRGRARARLGFFDGAAGRPLWPKVVEWFETLS